VAIVLIGVLYNTHTSTTIAFLIGVATLSIVFRDPRYVLAGAAGLPVAILISGGYYLRVLRNHLHAAQFWVRNVRYTRAHQIDDSPVFRTANGSQQSSQGLYRSKLSLLTRVLGENPFILAMLVTPIPQNIWAEHMYWWAVSILVWSVLTTFGGPLRILGPGFHYMKASVFPSAYTLAVTVNIQEGALSFVGLVVVISLMASFAALAYFYRVMGRRQTEHTASTPPDLAEAASYLRTMPSRRVLVLPSMYADFVAYNAQSCVVWGGHSGDLRRFAEFYPVLQKPLEYFVEKYAVDYLILDHAYATPERLGISERVAPVERFGAISVYEWVRAPTRVVSNRLVR